MSPQTRELAAIAAMQALIRPDHTVGMKSKAEIDAYMQSVASMAVAYADALHRKLLIG